MATFAFLVLTAAVGGEAMFATPARAAGLAALTALCVWGAL